LIILKKVKGIAIIIEKIAAFANELIRKELIVIPIDSKTTRKNQIFNMNFKSYFINKENIKKMKINENMNEKILAPIVGSTELSNPKGKTPSFEGE
jgi:hypothetical protein